MRTYLNLRSFISYLLGFLFLFFAGGIVAKLAGAFESAGGVDGS